MEILQKKLDFLLKKYSIQVNAVLKDKKTVIIDGRELPIFPHRSERRFIELKKIVQEGTLDGISAMRAMEIAEKTSDIYEILYRELDLCEFILGKSIKSVMAMENENVLNTVAVADDGVVCTVEIAATLKKREPPKDKHEVISRSGIACDIVVDAQLKPDSIYVFGEENQKFTDTDFELFGLSEKETAVVRAAFAAAKNKNFDDLIATDKRLCALVEKSKKSAYSGKKESIAV